MLRTRLLVCLATTSLKSILLFVHDAAQWVSCAPCICLLKIDFTIWRLCCALARTSKTSNAPNASNAQFLIFSVQYPRWVLFVYEKVSKFAMPNGWKSAWRQTYRKCFRSPSKKMWKFSVQEGERTALISCIVMRRCILFAPTHTIQVWGYCIVYSCTGHSTTFFDVNESQLHTFFIYIMPYSGLVGKNYFYNEKIVVFSVCCRTLY